MDWIRDHLWVAWLAASALLACTEMLTLDFTLLMLATGALAGAGTAFLFPGAWLAQVIVAVTVATLLLALLRPTLLRRVRNAPGYRSSLDTLVGSQGMVTNRVSDDDGQVKVHGETWAARPVTPGLVINSGEPVEVYEVDATTLLVYPARQALGWGERPQV